MTENRFMDALRSFLVADDDERRAIERRMHDGVQQQLVAVAVNLQLARGLVDAKADEAVVLLDDVRAVVADALDELRELAQRIHPSLLDTHGLIAALRSAAGAARIPTRVDGVVEETMPLDVALTVYRCCVATLTATEGETARATITVQSRDGAVEFEISLSGGRVGAGTLEPLAARVEALGGSLDAAPDRVAGRLPLTS
jgi:signal transduction histidine kinase